MKRICAFCGKEFEATNGKQKFCKGIHTKICKVCGKEFVIDNSKLGSRDAPVTCSKECRNILRKSTNLSKYGGVAPASSEDVRRKMQATNLERYGVSHGAQSEQAKEKAKNTALSKYGKEYFVQTDEYKQKAKITSRAVYGTDHPMQSEIVKQHTRDTNIQRYGVCNPMCSACAKTNFIASHMTDSSKSEEFIKFKQDPRSYIISMQLDHKPTIYELTEILGVNASTVGHYILSNECKDMISYSISTMEQQVIQYIQSLDNSIKIEYNVHDVIKPYELDIYLPDYKLAIECNPTATHNSTINVFDRGPSEIYPSYHKKKTDMCEQKGIFLFHIFGYEWSHRRTIIESMIRNMLGRTSIKIYARNTHIKHLDGKETKIFLDSNHRQGNSNSSVRLGLYSDESDELVSVMTFSKIRSTIGTSNCDDSDCWELVRFCSKLDTSVVGAASKLFQHFITEYSPNKVRSFSDRAHTRGGLYSKLGFKELRRSDPGYVWVDMNTDTAYNRVNAQKQNIRKFLNDDTIDLSDTEKQIMESHGYVQVFDSGAINWEYIP